MQFNFDDSEFRRLSNALHRYARRGVPHAAREGLNRSVFEVRKTWAAEVEDTFTLRNRFTVSSLRYKKARGTRLERMEARVGSTAEYMATQEHGGTERKSGKHGVPIPTPAASGQGRSSKRTKPIRKRQRLPNITLRNVRSLAGRKQRNAAAIAMARRAGKKHAFLDLGNRKGIFQIKGGKRRITRVDLIYDLSEPTVRTKPTHTLERSIDANMRKLPRYHIEALRGQLRRNGVTRF